MGSTEGEVGLAGAERHEYFDLWLHTTDELQRLLGLAIVSRETIHDWPLSTVQKITTADGRPLIYKCQHHATVEPEFYRLARSRLLPEHQYLGKLNGCDIMVFEYIDGQRLADCTLSEDDIVRIGRELQAEVQALGPGLPVFADIGTAQKWRAFVDTVLGRLTDLVRGGIFADTDLSLVDALRQWADGHHLLHRGSLLRGHRAPRRPKGGPSRTLGHEPDRHVRDVHRDAGTHDHARGGSVIAEANAEKAEKSSVTNYRAEKSRRS